jgi:zinc transporter 1/2/3
VDAICAGILLYVGFILLFLDFPRDMKRATGSRAKRPLLKALAMYMVLWVGAGLMAFIGRYL